MCIFRVIIGKNSPVKMICRAVLRFCASSRMLAVARTVNLLDEKRVLVYAPRILHVY